MKKFKVHIYPKNDLLYCIDVLSINYPANINTTIIIDKNTKEVSADFECNVFVDARIMLKDLSKEIGLTINSNRINKYGMYL